MQPLLQIRELQIGFRQRTKDIYVVHGINLELYRGETLAIVGESGCGKSLTALAIMGLLHSQTRRSNYIVSGRVQLQPEGTEPMELLGFSNRVLDTIRGSRMSMIFQEASSALNPLLTIGDQIAEVLVKHKGLSKAEAWTKGEALLSDMGIAEARQRMRSYPFQLSGGQRQRVMIAIAMACEPDLLIADEPTTALDVTVQSQILYLLGQIKETLGTSILFITHNLGVVAQFADRVAVMYRGLVVESGRVEELLREPKHPYTQLLLRSIPHKGLRAADGDRLETIRGTVPAPSVEIKGCPFHTRCPAAMSQCSQELPPEVNYDGGHRVRCYLEVEA